MAQDSYRDADYHRDHDQNHHRNRERLRDPIYRKERIPRRKITDAQVISVVGTIAGSVSI